MTNTSRLKLFVTLAAVLLVVFSIRPRTSEAQPGNDVKIVVYLIEASNGVPGVDPQIRGIVKQFQGTFRYSTYRLVSKIPKKISIGDDEKIALPGSRELRLYVRGHEDKRIKLKVKVLQKPERGGSKEMLSTEFRIVEGGTIIIGGYEHHGNKLIVAISADM